MIARFLAVDTTAVSDAMDALGLANGIAGGIVPVSVQRRIAGPVVTVTLEPAAGRRAVNHLGTAAIDASQPGDIIVVSHGGPDDVSGWGGLLSLGASLRGVGGVIVDGACRDADEMIDLDFAVYARRTTPRTARGRIIETAWSEPVRIGGVLVAPGDYVIADRSGVVFVPRARVADVLAAAEDVCAREAEMGRMLRAKSSIVDALASYETMLKENSK